MSDYVHKKVIRLPFPNEILDKCNTTDPNDCFKYLKDLLGDYWENNKINSFELGFSDTDYYIDWEYYHTYGEKSDEHGYVRFLTQKELETIKPYFDKLNVNYQDNDLRIVDYCYYNSCEAPDYYDIPENDDSIDFIS
jgi:hypothetical protein